MEQAERLDRAAEALGSAKKDLVADLVARYVDPDTVRGLRRLRGLGLSDQPEPSPPIVIEGDDAGWTMGHHSFQPSELPEVLIPAQAALLLQVDEGTVLEMAEKGHIPGRKVGDEWRFSRLALMAWLAGPASGGEG